MPGFIEKLKHNLDNKILDVSVAANNLTQRLIHKLSNLPLRTARMMQLTGTKPTPVDLKSDVKNILKGVDKFLNTQVTAHPFSISPNGVPSALGFQLGVPSTIGNELSYAATAATAPAVISGLYYNPLGTLSAVGGSIAGSEIGGNITEDMGVGRGSGSLLGGLFGGYRGYRWGTNATKRAAEIAMRTGDNTFSGNPDFKIMWNNFKNFPFKRKLSNLNYLLTGTRVGPRGYYNSLTGENDWYYSGFNKEVDADDLIDAFLYNKPISEQYGMRLITDPEYIKTHHYNVLDKVAKKFGYSDRKMPVYEIMSNRTVNPPEKIDYRINASADPDLPSLDDIYPNMGRHLIYSSDKGEVMRADLWKFHPDSYNKYWLEGKGNWAKKWGLDIINNLSTPIKLFRPWEKEFIRFYLNPKGSLNELD